MNSAERAGRYATRIARAKNAAIPALAPHVVEPSPNGLSRGPEEAGIEGGAGALGFAVIERIGQESYDRIETEIREVADVGRRRFDEKLGWVMEFAEDIKSHAQVVEISHTAQEQVKTQGLHQRSADVFDQDVKEMEFLPRPKSVKEQVDHYLSMEGGKVGEGKILLGTSDTLESIFGKYKNFSHGPFNEMGKMLLTIPLLTVNITIDFVKEAMERIRGIDVDEWAKDVFGPSTLSKRRLAFDH